MHEDQDETERFRNRNPLAIDEYARIMHSLLADISNQLNILNYNLDFFCKKLEEFRNG